MLKQDAYEEVKEIQADLTLKSIIEHSSDNKLEDVDNQVLKTALTLKEHEEIKNEV